MRAINILGSSPIWLEKRIQGFKDSRGQGSKGTKDRGQVSGFKNQSHFQLLSSLFT